MMDTNIYRALRDLLPAPALTVATVVSAHADGTATISYPGGAQQRVRGTGSVGAQVFVRDGRIEGPAPQLPSVTIEV